MSSTVLSWNILWHCPSLGLEWKVTFSSPVVTAEFSKFADIMSAALQQHRLLGFLNSSPRIPSPQLALFIVMLPKAHFPIPGCPWPHHCGYLGHWDLFLDIVLCIFAGAGRCLGNLQFLKVKEVEEEEEEEERRGRGKVSSYHSSVYCSLRLTKPSMASQVVQW